MRPNDKTEPDVVLPANPLDFLKYGGSMGQMIQAYNWENHPMGKPEFWPLCLKTNLRMILASGFPMLIWWTDQLYALYNDSCIPLLGNKHSWAMGKRASQVWAETWEQQKEAINHVLKTGKPLFYEAALQIIERHGYQEETYWTFSFSPVFNDAGKINGLLCTCTDSTAGVLSRRRLTTLKDLSEAVAHTQTLDEVYTKTCDIISNNAHDIPFSLLYLVDAEAKKAILKCYTGELAPEGLQHTVYLSLAGEKQLWPLEEVWQTGQFKLFDLSPVISSGSESASAGIKQGVVMPICKPGTDDEIIGFFVAAISPYLPYNVGYQNFHEVVTRQLAIFINTVEARGKIAQQQVLLTELFRQAPIGIVIVKKLDYKVELINPVACTLLGRPEQDIAGKKIFEALPELQGQGIKDLLDQVFLTGIPNVNDEMEAVLETNGVLEKRYFSQLYHPLRNLQGEVAALIVVAVEVTKQVEARHEVERINAQLTAINADLDNFVYAASHDLKAPILNIEGLVQALVKQMPADVLQSQVVQQLFSYITSSIDRFKKAVADLSEVAKVQRDGEEDTTTLNLAEVVAAVLLDFETTIAATRAHITLDFVPGSAIQYSAKNLRSIVYNLISNALKYHSAERNLQIKISTHIEPPFLVLTVSDNGLGLNMSDSSKVFQMFKRLHDHVEGSGIGLYIVKRIVENAGGRVEVESEKNKGTTFRVYFRY